MRKRKHMAEILRRIEEIRDNEGYAVIDIYCDRESLFDPLSGGNNRDLSGDIYDFIDRQANIVPDVIPLKIKFRGLDLSESEQQEVRDIMKRHYTMNSYDVIWDKAMNFRKTIGLFLFGLAALSVYFYLTFAAGNPMATEILSIIGSFSVWEATNAFLLERTALKRKYSAAMQNINQKIEFVPAASVKPYEK